MSAPCRHLRGRAPGSSGPEEPEPWDQGGEGNRSFWCLRTMDVAGPDDSYVHGESCRAGRDCYEPPEPDPSL